MVGPFGMGRVDHVGVSILSAWAAASHGAGKFHLPASARKLPHFSFRLPAPREHFGPLSAGSVRRVPSDAMRTLSVRPSGRPAAAQQCRELSGRGADVGERGSPVELGTSDEGALPNGRSWPIVLKKSLSRRAVAATSEKVEEYSTAAWFFNTIGREPTGCLGLTRVRLLTLDRSTDGFLNASACQLRLWNPVNVSAC